MSRSFLLLLGSWILAPALFANPSVKDLDDANHFLAGMPLPHGKSKLTDSSTWTYHQEQLDKEWARYEKSTLAPMRAFAASQLTPSAAKSKVVRYMFSGPDILHVLQMFPEAKTYILCGLEPVGTAPQLDGLSSGQASQALAQIRKSLEESIQFSFFRTIDMKTELRQAVFPGTLPIMGVFLARSGYSVTELEYLELQEDGTLSSLGTKANSPAAVRVKFSNKKDTKELFYFTTDISDGDVNKSGYMAYLESLPAGDSYVKAASYLMHNAYFSSIRSHLLSFSSMLVQDDSGIPLRHFDRESWNITHYGVYTKPIDLFAERYQDDLRQAYRSGPVTPLDFGTGYRWRKNESNLMRAVRKSP